MPLVIVGKPKRASLRSRFKVKPLKRTSAMPHYRLYILDKRGDVEGAVDLDCSDDETAKERMKVVLRDQRGELWRLVTASDLNDSSVEPNLQ